MSKDTFDYRGYMVSLGYDEEDIPEEFTDEEKDEIYFSALQGAIKEYKEREKVLSPLSSSKEQGVRAMQKFFADNPDTRQEFGLPEEITDKEEPYNLENFGRYIQRKFPGETNLAEPAQNYLKSYFDEEIFNESMPYVRPFLQGQNKEEVRKHFMEAHGIDKDTTVNEILQKTFRKGERQPWYAGEKLPEGQTGLWYNFKAGAVESANRALGEFQKVIGDALDIPGLTLSGLRNMQQAEAIGYNYNAQFKEKDGIIDTWDKYKDTGFFERIGHTVYSATERAARGAAPTLEILGAEILGRTIAGAAAGPAGAAAATASIPSAVSKLTKVWNGIKAVAPAARFSGVGASAFYMLGEPMGQAMEDGVYSRDYADKAVIFGMLATGSEYMGILALRGSSATMKLANRALGKKLSENKAFEYVFGRMPEPGEIEKVKLLGRQWAARYGFGTLWETVEESGTEGFQDWLARSFSQSLGAEYKEGEIGKESLEAALTAIPTTLALRGLGGIKSYRDFRNLNKGIEERRKQIEESGGIGSGVADDKDLSNFSAKAIQSGKVWQDQIAQAGKDTIVLSYGGDTGVGETKSQAAQNLLYARNAKSLGSIDAEAIETGDNPNQASVAYGPEGKKVTYISQDGDAAQKLKELVDDHNAADSPFLLSEGMTIEEFKEGDKTRYYVTFPDDPIFEDSSTFGGVRVDIGNKRRIVDDLNSPEALDRLYSRIDLHIAPVDVASEIGDVQLPRDYTSLDDAGLKSINKNFQLLSKGEGKLVFMDMKNRLVYSVSDVGKKEGSIDVGRKVKVTVSTPQGRVLSLGGKVREQTLVDKNGNTVSDSINLSGIRAGIRAQERTVSGKTEYYFDVGEFEKRGGAFGLKVNRDPKNGSNQHRIVAKIASGRNLTIDVNEVTGELMVNYQGQSMQVGKAFEISDLNNKESLTYAFTMRGEYEYVAPSPDGKNTLFRVRNGNTVANFLVRNSDGKIVAVLDARQVQQPQAQPQQQPQRQTKPTYTVQNLIDKFPENSDQIQRGYVVVKGDAELKFLTSIPDDTSLDNFTNEIENASIIFEEELETYAELLASSQEPSLFGTRLRRVLFVRDKNLDRKISILFSSTSENDIELNEQLQGKESLLNSLISDGATIQDLNLTQGQSLVDAFNMQMDDIIAGQDGDIIDLYIEEEFGEEGLDALEFGEEESEERALVSLAPKEVTIDKNEDFINKITGLKPGTKVEDADGNIWQFQDLEEIAYYGLTGNYNYRWRVRRNIHEFEKEFKTEKEAIKFIIDNFVRWEGDDAKITLRVYSEYDTFDDNVESDIDRVLERLKNEKRKEKESKDELPPGILRSLANEKTGEITGDEETAQEVLEGVATEGQGDRVRRELKEKTEEWKELYGNLQDAKNNRRMTKKDSSERDRAERELESAKAALNEFLESPKTPTILKYRIKEMDNLWSVKKLANEIGRRNDLKIYVGARLFGKKGDRKVWISAANNRGEEFDIETTDQEIGARLFQRSTKTYQAVSNKTWRQHYAKKLRDQGIIDSADLESDFVYIVNHNGNIKYYRYKKGETGNGYKEPDAMWEEITKDMQDIRKSLIIENLRTQLASLSEHNVRGNLGYFVRVYGRDQRWVNDTKKKIKAKLGKDVDFNIGMIKRKLTKEEIDRIPGKNKNESDVDYIARISNFMQAFRVDVNNGFIFTRPTDQDWDSIYNIIVNSFIGFNSLRMISNEEYNRFQSIELSGEARTFAQMEAEKQKLQTFVEQMNSALELDENEKLSIRISQRIRTTDDPYYVFKVEYEKNGNVAYSTDFNFNANTTLAQAKKVALRVLLDKFEKNIQTASSNEEHRIEFEERSGGQWYIYHHSSTNSRSPIIAGKDSNDFNGVIEQIRKYFSEQNLISEVADSRSAKIAGWTQALRGTPFDIQVEYDGNTPIGLRIVAKAPEAKGNINITEFGITEDYILNVYNGSKDNVDLSNFASRPIEVEGKKFSSAEAYYHSLKLDYLDESKIPNGYSLQSFREMMLGRILSGWNLKTIGDSLNRMVNKEWETKRAEELEKAMRLSFEQNESAAKRLLATGNARFSHINRNNPTRDTGWSREVFPQILEKIRTELREQHPDWAQEASNRALDDFTPEIDRRILDIKRKFGTQKGPSSDFQAQVEVAVEEQNMQHELGRRGFVMYSGGAEGSDFFWGKVASEYGLTTEGDDPSIKHYWRGSRTPHGNIEMPSDDIEEATDEVFKAANMLNRVPRNGQFKSTTLNLLTRNWMQVKGLLDTDGAVFAFGELENVESKDGDYESPSVKGGTGWAVQMAMQNEVIVYVYNTKRSRNYEKGWYIISPEYVDAEKLDDVPILTKNFAGIGTRAQGNEELRKEIEREIRKVFDKTLENLLQQEQRQISNITVHPVLNVFGIQEEGTSNNEKNLIDQIKSYSVIPKDLFEEFQSADYKFEAGFIFYDPSDDQLIAGEGRARILSNEVRDRLFNNRSRDNILKNDGSPYTNSSRNALFININSNNTIDVDIIKNAVNALPIFRLVNKQGNVIVSSTDYSTFLTGIRNVSEARRRGQTRKSIVDFTRADIRALIQSSEQTGASASVRIISNPLPRMNETTPYSAPEGPRARSIEQELNETYGEALTTSLMGTGMLRVIPDQGAAMELFTSLRGEPITSLNGKFQGFCDASGVVYLVEDGIRDGDVHKVMVHERGVHAGLLGFTKSAKFMEVLNYLRDHANDDTDEGRAIKEALDRLPSWTKPQEKWMEVLAYLCENRVDKASGIIQRFVAAVKKWLFEHGFISVERFSIDDFVTLAQAAVRAEIRHSDIVRENLYASAGGMKGAKNLERERMNNYVKALEMFEAGKDMSAIKLATGWEYKDGAWQFDLPNGTLKEELYKKVDRFNNDVNLIGSDIPPNNVGKLSDIYDAEELYKAYPDAKNIEIILDNSIDHLGYYRNKQITLNTIGIYSDAKDYDGTKEEFLRGVLIHEIQHFIQEVEGFPNGTSEAMFREIFNGMNDSEALQLVNDEMEEAKGEYISSVAKNIKNLLTDKSISIEDIKKKIEDINKNVVYSPDEILRRFDKSLYDSLGKQSLAKFKKYKTAVPAFPGEKTSMNTFYVNYLNLKNFYDLIDTYGLDYNLFYSLSAGEQQARREDYTKSLTQEEKQKILITDYNKNEKLKVGKGREIVRIQELPTLYTDHIFELFPPAGDYPVNIHNSSNHIYTDEHARIFGVSQSDFQTSIEREFAKVSEDGELKAPNGQPTRLSQRDYFLVRTPEFKQKYGDWENKRTNLPLDPVTREPNLNASRDYQRDLAQARQERRSETVASYGTPVAEGVYVKGKNVTVDLEETDREDGKDYAKAKINAAKYRERGDYVALENSIAALESSYPELYDTIELEGGGISGFISTIMKTESVYLGDPTLDAIVRDLKVFMHKVYKDMNGEYEKAVDPRTMKAIADGISGREYQSLESTLRNPVEARNMYINQEVLDAAYPIAPQKSLLDGVQEDIQNLLNSVASGYTYEISPEGEPVVVDPSGGRTVLQGVSPAHAAGVIEHILLKERVSQYNAPSDREQENPIFYSNLIEENKGNLPADYRNRQAVLDEVLVNKILACIPDHIRARIRIHRDKNDPDTRQLLVNSNSNGIFIPFTDNSQPIHLRAFDISIEDFIKSLSEEVGHYSWQLLATKELMAVIEPLYSVLQSRIESDLQNYVTKLKGKNENLSIFNKMILLNEFFAKNQVSILERSEAELAQWCDAIFQEKSDEIKEKVLKAREAFAQQVENIAVELDTALFDVKAKDRKQRMDNFFKSMLTAIMAPASGKSVVVSLPGLSGDTVRIQVNDWGQMRKVYPKSVEASIRQKIEKLCEGKSDRVKSFLIWRFNNLPHNPPLPDFLVNNLAKVIKFTTGEKLENAKEWIRLPGGFVGDTIVGKDVTIMLARAFQAITSDYGLHLRKRYIDNTKFTNYLLKNNLNPDAVDKSKGYVVFMNEHGLDDSKMLELAQEFDMFLREGVSRIEDNVIKIRQEFLRTIDSIRNYGNSRGLEQNVIESMVKQVQDTMARFEGDYTHRSYRAYTPEGRADIIEMQKYLHETDPVNFLLNKKAAAQRKIDEEREKWKPSDGSPSKQTEAQYRKNIKDAEHIVELADRMQALRSYAVGKVNEEDEKRRKSQGKEGAKLIDVDDYVFVGGTFEQRVFNVMKSTLNKLLEKNVERKHNKGDKEHSRFTAVAGAMKKKLDETNEVENAYIKFLKPITNPLESLLLSLDQQEKVINKIAFNRMLGEKILDYGMGDFKKEFDVTVPQGITNIGFKENGTFLYFLQLSDFFQRRFEEEYEVASAFVKNTFLDKYFGLVRANLTVYNPKLMVSNYISNISVAAATGHLFRFANYAKATPAIRDSWMKQIFGGQTKSAAVRRLLEEIQEHQVIGGSASSTEMRMFARGQHEQFLDSLLGSLEKVRLLSKNGRFNVNNFVSDILEKAREIYGYGDEWVKILAYLNNRDVSTAKYEAQLDPDDRNYAEKVRRAAAKDAANLTQLETTTWELSPMMIRQLAKSGIRVLTPDFIMHNFQIARMMAVGVGRYREVWSEIGKLREIRNRTPQQERYLELLQGEAARRTAGLALGTSAMIGIATGPIYLFPYLVSSLLPHLFFGGDDDDNENRRHLTPAEYRGAQMLLNSTMEFDNMWTPLYRTGKYTFVATNYQRQNAGETLFAPRRPTEDDFSLRAWGIDTVRMLMNPNADNILGQIYNGLRGKDRYGQQVGYWRSLGELAVRGVIPQAGEQAIFTATALTSWAQGGDLRGRTAADLVAGRPATQHLAHKAWELAGAGFREYDVRDLTTSQAYKMKQGIGNAQNPVRRDFIQSVINNPGMSDSRMVSEIEDMMASNRQRLGKAGYAVTASRYWGLTEKEIATYLNKGRNAPSTVVLSQADSDKIRFGENIFDQHIIQSLKEQRKNFAGKMRDDSKYTQEQRKEIVDTIDRFIAKYEEMMGQSSYTPEKSRSSDRKETRRPTGKNEYDQNIYQRGTQGGNVNIRRVIDGDTYELQGSRGNVYRVRLAGIDSPELSQEGFGMAARDRARELFANAAKIDREILYGDHHGRPVGKITLTMQDGTKLDMGEELIKSGNAFVYDQYSHDPEYLAQIKAAERNAQNRGTGVYGEGNTQRPWEYRAENR